MTTCLHRNMSLIALAPDHANPISQLNWVHYQSSTCHADISALKFSDVSCNWLCKIIHKDDWNCQNFLTNQAQIITDNIPLIRFRECC